MEEQKGRIREFHLFAGIGRGIYGGQLLGHKCVGASTVDPVSMHNYELWKKDAGIL